MNILVGLLRFGSVSLIFACIGSITSLFSVIYYEDSSAVSVVPSLLIVFCFYIVFAILFWRSANGVAAFHRNASQRDREIESMHDEIRTLQNEIAFLQGLNGSAQANRASQQSRCAPVPQQDDEEE